ncbi:hypothetical protein ACOZ38_23765 [Sphaerisporangium viridialbum]|uniref:hypothetical protein n=1 Tax=Sphaerisporangium viridialbum TaxID=46189 RepID=UPI003C78AAF8
MHPGRRPGRFRFGELERGPITAMKVGSRTAAPAAGRSAADFDGDEFRNAYEIPTSTNGTAWTSAQATTTGDRGSDDLDLPEPRLALTPRGNSYGHSLHDSGI